MAGKARVILFSLVVLTLIESSRAGSGIGTYWGQNTFEGSLNDACSSGLYSYVNIAFLNTFGSAQVPQLNLGGHCDPRYGQCVGLTTDILNCQKLGIKVMLSLGGPTGTYTLTSTEDAKNLAIYLWNNFLGGQSATRPFGTAVLDGIDFDIDLGSNQYYSDLARFLADYSKQGTKVYLSATPRCTFPDSYMGTAISTGLFDFIWIKFYNNPACEYAVGNIQSLTSAWTKWTSSVPSSTMFLELPASADAATSGFIPTDVLINQIFPHVKTSPNYGGIMIWSRYYDSLSGYSKSVKGDVPQQIELKSSLEDEGRSCSSA